MSIAKLVTGIISTVAFVIVFFQSCAISFTNKMSGQLNIDGAVGILVACLILAMGIVSIVTRNSKSNGCCIAILSMSITALFIGYMFMGDFQDLIIWLIWSAVMGVLSVFVQLFLNIK